MESFFMLSNDENEAGLFFQLKLSKGVFSRTVQSHLGILEITPYVPKPASGINHNSNFLFFPPVIENLRWKVIMSLVSREAETTCFRTFCFPFQEKKSLTINQVKSNCLQSRLQTDFVTQRI